MGPKIYTEKEFNDALTNAMDVYAGLQLRGAINGVILVTAAGVLVAVGMHVTDAIITRIRRNKMIKMAKQISDKT